jgi:ABC-type sugar transport system permease subunit
MPLVAYRTAFREFHLGRASAISAVMFMILLVLVVFFFRYRAERDLQDS